VEPAHPFSGWAGTWRGDGQGEYPTIEGFSYIEELVIEPVPGRAVAHWRSRTRDAGTGEPRHAESGFLRSTPSGIELVVAHSFGIAEVAAGTLDGAVLRLTSDGLGHTATAKEVTRVERRYELGADTIAYSTSMAAVGEPLTHHLRAMLRWSTSERDGQ
jgi:THAP4-like, heme-binding beta-barrel domain